MKHPKIESSAGEHATREHFKKLSALANEAKKWRLVFENDKYRIHKIYMNWRIYIKERIGFKKGQAPLDRDFYCSSDKSLERAKAMAERLLEEYFDISIVNPKLTSIEKLKQFRFKKKS